MSESLPFTEAAYIGLILIIVAVLYTASIMKLMWEFKASTYTQIRNWAEHFPLSYAQTKPLLAAFLMMFFIPTLIAIITIRFGWVTEDQVLPITLPFQLLFAVALLMLLSYKIMESGSTFKGVYGARKGETFRHITIGLAAYVVIYPWVLNGHMITQFVLEWVDYAPITQEALTALKDETYGIPTRLMLVVHAALLGPIIEEFIFRGVLMVSLIRLTSIKQGIFWSSLLFAMLHVNVASLLPLFVLSVGFSIVYVYSRSIIAPITTHIAFNMITIVSYLNSTETGL